jgi:hypothetical protein
MARHAGFAVHAVVHPEDYQDRDGGVLVLATLFGMYPFLQTLFADAGHRGPQFHNALGSSARARVQISTRRRRDETASAKKQSRHLTFGQAIHLERLPSPAVLLGHVEATDEQTAIEKAIEHFEIEPALRNSFSRGGGELHAAAGYPTPWRTWRLLNSSCAVTNLPAQGPTIVADCSRNLQSLERINCHEISVGCTDRSVHDHGVRTGSECSRLRSRCVSGRLRRAPWCRGRTASCHRASEGGRHPPLMGGRNWLNAPRSARRYAAALAKATCPKLGPISSFGRLVARSAATPTILSGSALPVPWGNFSGPLQKRDTFQRSS